MISRDLKTFFLNPQRQGTGRTSGMLATKKKDISSRIVAVPRAQYSNSALCKTNKG